MKKILLGILLSIFVAVPSEARAQGADQNVRELIKHYRSQFEKLSETELLKFTISPSVNVPQGNSATIFLQPLSRYTNANVILRATLDGSEVSLSQPTADLWVYSSAGLNEIRQHTLSVSFYLENKDQAAQIRASLAQIDLDITNLQNQIDTTTDPVLRDQLIAQRDAKIALKNDLIDTLEQLKTAVGVENFDFNTVKNETGQDFPTITSVGPNFGNVLGGQGVTVSGANLLGANEVVIGGISVPAEVLSSARVSFVTPTFSTVGPKDVEVRIPQPSGGVKNAVLKNGFFAGDLAGGPGAGQNLAPVAVAGPSQTLNFGAQATLDGNASFDFNSDPIFYSWKLVSSPEGSRKALGTEVAATATFSFLPDAPGAYVFELVVQESDSADQLVSAPSLTTVRFLAPANSAPVVTANPITVATGGTINSVLTVGDADFWQTRKIIITSAPQLGTAVIAGNAVTYTAGNTAGSDSVGVTVVDNGEPIRSTSVSIPVTVVAGDAAPTTGNLFRFQISDGVPVKMRYNLTTPADSDGSLGRIFFDFGDGTGGFGTLAPFFNVLHDTFNFASTNVAETVYDNLGANTSNTTTFDLTPYATNHRPVDRLSVSTISGAAPLSVTFNATNSFDPDGESPLPVVRWLFGDGNPELSGGSELLTTTHVFNNPGVYNVRLRIRDSLNAETDSFVTIYVGITPPTAGTAPQADYRFDSREVLVNTPLNFDAFRSNDPNPNASTLNYTWEIPDNSCPSALCTYTTQAASHIYHTVGNRFIDLQVQNQNGATSAKVFEEVFVVNQGHAPRGFFLMFPTTGVAPFTANFFATSVRSYDYDGTIVQHAWNFGDGSQVDTVSGETADHIYTVPNVYFVNHTVRDNDGNTHTVSQMLTVNPSFANAKAVTSDDEERAARRETLTNACGLNVDDACYELAKMYEEDGDTFTAQKLYERACELGNQAACSVAKWMKW